MPPLGQLYPQLNDVELPDAIPYSQVSAWELRFLYLLGRHQLTGKGKVIELGSGGGGSTYALALGLQENPDFDKKTNVAHYEGDHKRAWKFAKPLTSDEYLSRYRQDHFAQLEKALKGVRWRRLVLRAVPVKKVTGRA